MIEKNIQPNNDYIDCCEDTPDLPYEGLHVKLRAPGDCLLIFVD